jgi:hypothetical protein
MCSSQFQRKEEMRLSSNCTKALTSVLASLLLCAMPHQTRGAFIISFVQDGSDVDATGNGSFNLAALTGPGGGDTSALVDGGFPIALLGTTVGKQVDTYTGFTGPSSFGSDADTDATSGSGSIAGLFGASLDVPTGYVSGSLITDSDTFDSTTLADMGLTLGTYTYTWGTGPTADSLVINIGPTASSVPEPVSIGLVGVGAGVFMMRRKSREVPRKIARKITRKIA